MRVIRVAALGLAVVGLSAVGCSQTEAGSPAPAEGTSGAPSAESPSAEADAVPKVENPLDVSAYIDNPCAILGKDELVGMQFSPQGRTLDPESNEAAAINGPLCRWSHEDKVRKLGVGIQTGNQEIGTGGVAGIKKSFDAGNMGYFELTSVEGYPAAFTGQTDLRDAGTCSIAVSVQDDLSVWVQADTFVDNPEQACPTAEKAASMMMKNLKRGA